MTRHFMKQTRRFATAALSAIAVTALVPFATPSAFAALAATGPVDAASGFPTLYTDSNGLSLQPCTDPAPLCFEGRPDQAAPLAFPGNFPPGGEIFYQYATADIARPGGALTFFEGALEGAFLPDVAQGNQVAFGRIRIRIFGLVPGRSYTVTHPYGQSTFTVNAKGQINDTVDIGCLAPPCAANFGAALTSNIGPYLKWDPAVAPAAPAGFIGTLAQTHTVVGSPAGTNFFKIDGPDIGGLGVNTITTNLFSVAGKLAAPPAGAAASLTPTSLAFPNTKVGVPSAVQNATVTNTGGAALTISTLGLAGANAADFQIITDTCTGRTVARAATCSVGLRFNPTAGGARSAILNVIDNAANSPQALTMTGTGLAAVLTPTPVSVDFGPVKIDTSSANRTITLASTGTDDVIIDTVEVTGAGATDFLLQEDNCAGVTLRAGMNCTVVMAFSPTATGARSATLSVLNNTPTSPLTIPMRGTGTAPLASFNPSSVTFGSQLILLSTAEQRVTLTNRGNAVMAISGFSIGGANARDFSIGTNTCGATLLQGRSCFITVKFAPTFIGSRTATLDLASDVPASSPRTVTLSGTGNLIVI